MNIIDKLELGDTPFNRVKLMLCNKPYCFNISETPSLYRICLNKLYYNPDDTIHRVINGIILEKNTNKIICQSFDYIDELKPDDINGTKWENTIFEEIIDGSLIRLYYYKDQWRTATTKSICAECAYWHNEKSFNELFEEALIISNPDFNYTVLNINLNYFFVLQHPENRILLKVDTPKVYHIGTRDLTTLKEIETDIGIDKPIKYKSGSLKDTLKTIEDLPYDVRGYMLIGDEFERRKIINPRYTDIKELKGQDLKPEYRYLQFRKSNDKSNLDTYLLYFPEHTERFNDIKKRINKLIITTYKHYINLYIKKIEYYNPPRFLLDIIKEIHLRYQIEKKKITHQYVCYYINNFSIERLAILLRIY